MLGTYMCIGGHIRHVRLAQLCNLLKVSKLSKWMAHGVKNGPGTISAGAYACVGVYVVGRPTVCLPQIHRHPDQCLLRDAVLSCRSTCLVTMRTHMCDMQVPFVHVNVHIEHNMYPQ